MANGELRGAQNGRNRGPSRDTGAADHHADAHAGGAGDRDGGRARRGGTAPERDRRSDRLEARRGIVADKTARHAVDDPRSDDAVRGTRARGRVATQCERGGGREALKTVRCAAVHTQEAAVVVQGEAATIHTGQCADIEQGAGGRGTTRDRQNATFAHRDITDGLHALPVRRAVVAELAAVQVHALGVGPATIVTGHQRVHGINDADLAGRAQGDHVAVGGGHRVIHGAQISLDEQGAIYFHRASAERTVTHG